MSDDFDKKAIKEALKGPDWGFMLNGAFRKLPKEPLLLGGFEPPCDVIMPSGEIRHVIVDPTLG